LGTFLKSVDLFFQLHFILIPEIGQILLLPLLWLEVAFSLIIPCENYHSRTIQILKITFLISTGII